MGSNQSVPDSATQKSSPSQPLTPQSSETLTDVATTSDQGAPKPKRKQNRSGFAQIQHKCRRKKKAYDECYSGLYGGFMLAKEIESTRCDEVFEDWRSCILRGMKKDREKRGLPPPKKESILAELYDDE